MSLPPFLIGATLLFWGWQTGFVWIALLMGALLEAARFLSIRWEFARIEFHRLCDLCSLLFLGALIYSYNSNELSKAVSAPLQWLPMLYFLFVAACAYSSQQNVPLSALFWLLRRRKSSQRSASVTQVGWVYLGLCLLAASAANRRDHWFYPGFCVLVGWALWQARPRRFHPAVPAGLLVVVILIGFYGQIGLQALQRLVEGKTSQWIAQFASGNFDPRESRTAMGQIGKLKSSGRIVLRVETPQSGQPPRLLRQISYTQFKGVTWYALRREFTAVDEPIPDEWQLSSSAGPANHAIISGYLREGRGVLSLPLGAKHLTQLPVGEVQKNRLGAVRVAGGPGLIRFQVDYGRESTLDSEPDEEDLHIPAAESPAIEQTLHGIILDPTLPEAAPQRIAEYLQTNFTYTTWLSPPPATSPASTTPLSRFLLQSRAGHCEYFASATVLLLRRLGIPARYCTGFAVPETTSASRVHLVRDRHAHAWAIAYIGGQWRDMDTTPASWETVEQDGASFFEPLTDWWSGIWYRYNQWRWLSQRSFRKYLPALLLPLVAILAWRVFWKKQRVKRAGSHNSAESITWPGGDSDYYRIEAHLCRLGRQRLLGETPAKYLQRMHATLPIETLPIIQLHYRYRFAPDPLTHEDRSSLKTSVQTWLARQQQQDTPA